MITLAGHGILVPEPIVALGVGVKAGALLAGAWLACAALRRRPAAVRHAVWTAALAGTVALALLAPVMPRVPVPVRVAFAPEGAAGPGIPPAAFVRALALLSAVWLAGAVLVGLRFALAHVALARLVRRARALPASRLPAGWGRERVVASGEVTAPLAWGALVPRIVLPARAGAWPAGRLAAALLHERAHVRRRDGLALAAAQLACALYWFVPFVWVAARAQREEGERACDDLVLAAGLPAHEYAAHLLAVATEAWGARPRAAAAAMAGGSGLERRIGAILAAGRARAGAGARAPRAALIAVALLVLPLATLRPRLMAAPAAVPAGPVATGAHPAP